MHIWTVAASDGTPFAKKYWLSPTGSLKNEQYPHVLQMSSQKHTVNTLADLHGLVTSVATQGAALVKGELLRDLVDEKRAGATSPSTLTQWVCLDFDGFLVQGQTPTVDQALQLLGLGDVSYVLQYSSSASLPQCPGLRCHVFMLLEGAITPSQLKVWLEHCNYSVPELANDLELAGSRVALRYPLDITTCQNDKLLYVAPPVLASGLTDPYPGAARVQLVTRSLDCIPLSRVLADAQLVMETRRKTIDDLRKKLGLGKVKGTIQYLPSGDEMLTGVPAGTMTITGLKSERGFTYMNLNGGDSWGYFHPDDDFKFLYNFKGEPVYSIKDALPSYYAEKQAQLEQATLEMGEPVPFVVADGAGKYVYGRYHPDIGVVGQWNTASSLKMVEDYFTALEVDPPEIIRTCRPVYDPTTHSVIDYEAETLNKFVPSPFMKMTGTETRTHQEGAQYLVQSTSLQWIGRLIKHAMSDDQTAIEYFLNWVAHIFKNRTKAGTAWILTGVQGSGKTVLFEQVLKPLLGESNALLLSLETLAEKFNSYQSESLLVVVDEVNVREHKGRDQLNNKLKMLVTGDTAPVRSMRKEAVQSRSWNSFILISNSKYPIDVEQGDRRYNMPAYQANKLDPSWVDTKAIAAELQAFANLLISIKVDEDRVRFPMASAQKASAQQVSLTDRERVADVLKSGDLMPLAKLMPNADESLDMFDLQRLKLAAHIFKRVCLDEISPDKISTNEIRVLYEYLLGKQMASEFKRVAWLDEMGLEVKNVRIGDKVVRGLTIPSKTLTPEQKDEVRDLIKDFL